MKRLLKSERGNILLMTAVLLVVLLLFAGVAVDLARAWVAREELQGAVDSAALAGSMSAVRMVEVTVQYGHTYECCFEDSCSSCCATDPPVRLVGTEKKLVDQGGWRRGTCGDKFLGIERRWIEYPSDAKSIANQILDMNWPGLLTPEGGGAKEGSNVTVYDAKSAYGPSVKVDARGNVKTALLNIIGINDLSFKRCGQSATFYDVVVNGWLLGRNDPPQDACKD
ncbi:MAG: Tad domain-containing protein [Peptococcaceae bacterium]|jgi:hypothetical protein|nr:Tad domain-containing protein [Peptococcaceae bacterium]